MMKRSLLSLLSVLLFAAATASLPAENEKEKAGVTYRRLPVAQYRDKLEAAWLGQMAGVTWGAPTEFRWNDQICPIEELPAWTPEMINDAFGQDDLYVEMTFLHSMEVYGLDVSIRQAGIDFANSKYDLWCANRAGRNNLRNGIAPPDSSHPNNTPCGNDIDYQIEADYSGIIAPGMPNAAIKLGEKFGRLMNYGDGVYGGIFVGAMYAEAYFENDIEKIIEAALRAIPAESQYAEMVRDVLAWYRENPDNWEETWEKLLVKYRQNPEYQKASNGGIDVKINGAYILMGLLYGKKDFDQTITISIRCGQDSDCNPSNAAGILFTTFGSAQIPDRFKQVNHEMEYAYTAFTFPRLLNVCEQLTRQILALEGGFVETDENGNEIFVIPVKEPVPPPFEKTYEPGPETGSRYTEEEMSRITEQPITDQ